MSLLDNFTQFNLTYICDRSDLELPSEELTRLLLTLSREEMLEQFGEQSS